MVVRLLLPTTVKEEQAMGVTVAEVMTRDVATLSPEMTLREMDRIFVERQVSGAPVVEGERLVGIVSQADVVRILYDEQNKAQQVSDFYGSPFPIDIPALDQLAKDSRKIADHLTKGTVGELMIPYPLTVSPSDDLESVARLMISEKIHRVLVTEEERLVGIVSSLDIVRLVAEVGLA